MKEVEGGPRVGSINAINGIYVASFILLLDKIYDVLISINSGGVIVVYPPMAYEHFDDASSVLLFGEMSSDAM